MPIHPNAPPPGGWALPVAVVMAAHTSTVSAGKEPAHWPVTNVDVLKTHHDPHAEDPVVVVHCRAAGRAGTTSTGGNDLTGDAGGGAHDRPEHGLLQNGVVQGDREVFGVVVADAEEDRLVV